MESPLQQKDSKPEDSMPFFGSSFFDSVEGFSEFVALGYIRLLWHYWNHTKCGGLPDDDEYLRRVCHCPREEWSRTKGILFDNDLFFCSNGNGKWHQKRALQIHEREVELYNRRVAWAANARAKKQGSNTNPDVKPNINRISQEKELERVEKRIEEVRNQAVRTATSINYTPDQRKELKALKDRQSQLKGELGYLA